MSERLLAGRAAAVHHIPRPSNEKKNALSEQQNLGVIIQDSSLMKRLEPKKRLKTVKVTNS